MGLEDFFVGIIIGFVILACVGLLFTEPNYVVKDLGQAICEEEYGMDYDGYDKQKDILKCKPKEVIKKYDGIEVKMGNRNK